MTGLDIWRCWSSLRRPAKMFGPRRSLIAPMHSLDTGGQVSGSKGGGGGTGIRQDSEPVQSNQTQEGGTAGKEGNRAAASLPCRNLCQLVAARKAPEHRLKEDLQMGLKGLLPNPQRDLNGAPGRGSQSYQAKCTPGTAHCQALPPAAHLKPDSYSHLWSRTERPFGMPRFGRAPLASPATSLSFGG